MINDEPNTMFPEKFVAIRRAILLGKQFSEEYEGLAEQAVKMYLDGTTKRDIVSQLGLAEILGTSDKVAEETVGYYFRGHKGGFRIEPYRGVIPSDVMEAIWKERCEGWIKNLTPEQRVEMGKKATVTNRKNKTGLFGFSDEDRSKYSKDAYARGREEGEGLGGLKPEERRRNGINSSISRGKIPWREREHYPTYSRFGELEFAYMLSCNSGFQYNEGSHKGKPNWKVIKGLVNAEYGNNRTEKKISAQVSRYKKKLLKDKR